MDFSPPSAEGSCDICDGDLYQRSDDNEETVRSRLQVYRRQTEPLIEYYGERGVLKKVAGSGRTPDEVFAAIEAILDRR